MNKDNRKKIQKYHLLAKALLKRVVNKNKKTQWENKKDTGKN